MHEHFDKLNANAEGERHLRPLSPFGLSLPGRNDFRPLRAVPSTPKVPITLTEPDDECLWSTSNPC